MKNILITILVPVTMLCCDDKHEIMSVSSLEGTYKGTFFRTSPEAKYQVSNVTLIFDGSKFEGSSNMTKYPAICHGTYTFTGHEIEFINLCPWTSEFDGSYVLSGKFKITKDGGEITMTKSHSDFAHDTYKLKPGILYTAWPGTH